MPKPFLSDEQWKKIEPLLRQSSGRGRPWADHRQVLEGILWGLKTGARWRDLPPEYPSPSWRRLQLWEESDVWLDVWRQLLAELDARGQLDWNESFVDGSFAPAKKGALVSGKPSGPRARSGWWGATAKVFLWESS